jgi:hypothetical protein
MKPIEASCSRSSTPVTTSKSRLNRAAARMIKIARMARMIPRGTVMGERIDGPPLSEAEHFWKCEACGGWIDMRDLGAVLDHEEPLPHPTCDQAQ